MNSIDNQKFKMIVRQAIQDYFGPLIWIYQRSKLWIQVKLKWVK